MMYESCIFNNFYSPNFPKHRASSQSHKHCRQIRASNHLHLSSFDDVHLSADLTLTGRAERDKSQFKTLIDKRLFHGGCLMWPLLRQPSNILDIILRLSTGGFKILLQCNSKASTVNHKNCKWHFAHFFTNKVSWKIHHRFQPLEHVKYHLSVTSLERTRDKDFSMAFTTHYSIIMWHFKQMKQDIQRETKWVNPLGTDWMVKSDLSLYDRCLDRRHSKIIALCYVRKVVSEASKQVIRFWWKITDNFFFTLKQWKNTDCKFYSIILFVIT